MTQKTIDYASLRAKLDEVLLRLQSDEVDIDEAVKLYKQGVELLAQIEAYLETAKNTVEKIQRTSKDLKG